MERFEDWFAVRIAHLDEEIWPSRLTYDPQDGISLNTINFAGPKLWYSNPTFEADTITGYLDYQRPATLLGPFIQSASAGSIGADTPCMRARYRVVANGLLKNLHLESRSERCFTGFRVQLPSFHAWVAPQLVRSDYAPQGNSFTLTVEVREPSRRTLALEGGVHAEILIYPSANEDNGDVPIIQHTVLSLALTEAVDYDTIARIAAAVDITFGFLVGTRLKSAIHYLPTSKMRRWNDSDEAITAESWIVPAWKRASTAPDRFGRMFIEANSPAGPEQLLQLCLSGSQDLFYLMNMILAAESNDLRPDDCFVELLGCLEDFDRTRLGSGADPEVRLLARRVKRLVERHGDDEERAICARIGASFRNEYSLRQRLERLMGMWSADGFRGGPDAARLVQIRNMKPHGRGRDLSADVFREIIILLPFLCALARYHVFKVLGFGREAVAAGFTRVPHRFGMFVPLDLIPGRAQPGDETDSSQLPPAA